MIDMKKFVWVIEIKFKNGKNWHPYPIICAECWLTKSEAKKALDRWKTGNPDDDFSIAKYFRSS